MKDSESEEERNGEIPVHVDRYSTLGQLMARNAVWLTRKFPDGDFDSKCVLKENGVGEERRWIACKAKHKDAISVAYMETCEMKRPTMKTLDEDYGERSLIVEAGGFERPTKWISMKDVKIPSELKMPAPGTPGCDTIDGCFAEWERMNFGDEKK